MSLYWHVANKEALLDGVVEVMLAEVAIERADEEDWHHASRRSVAPFGVSCCDTRTPCPSSPVGRWVPTLRRAA